MASVYMVRSLVPMAKKSATWVSASAASAAPGISIMTPMGGSGSAILTPRRLSRRDTVVSMSRTWRASATDDTRSEEHTSELQSLRHLVCRLLLEKKKTKKKQ